MPYSLIAKCIRTSLKIIGLFYSSVSLPGDLRPKQPKSNSSLFIFNTIRQGRFQIWRVRVARPRQRRRESPQEDDTRVTLRLATLSQYGQVVALGDPFPWSRSYCLTLYEPSCILFTSLPCPSRTFFLYLARTGAVQYLLSALICLAHQWHLQKCTTYDAYICSLQFHSLEGRGAFSLLLIILLNITWEI